MNVGELKKILANCDDDLEIRNGLVPLTCAYLSGKSIQLVFPGDEDPDDELLAEYAEEYEDLDDFEGNLDDCEGDFMDEDPEDPEDPDDAEDSYNDLPEPPEENWEDEHGFHRT